MTENVAMASLKDSEAKVKDIITRLKKNINRYESLDSSEIDRVSNQIYADLRLAKSELEAMKIEISNIKNEQNQKAYKDAITMLKGEISKLGDEFTNKQNQKKNLNGILLNEDIDIRMKGNNELTVQEAVKKGDGVLAQDRQGIARMNKVVKDDIQLANMISADLAKQQDQLGQVNRDLKEIDYSLNRAGKQLATMFKMYATDKLIMCMIVLIGLIILAIILVAALGGDSANKFNVPHDIFTNGAKNSTATTRILVFNPY